MDDKFEGFLEDEQLLVGEIQEETEIEGSLTESPVEVVLNDHNKLNNRDLPDQHPISAITGLEEELLSIKSKAQTNMMSIKDLQKNIDNKVRTTKSIPIDMKAHDYIFLEKEE